LVGAVLLAGLAFAMGDEQHVTGTVSKITDNTISVEVPRNKADAETTVTVNVISSTSSRK